MEECSNQKKCFRTQGNTEDIFSTSVSPCTWYLLIFWLWYEVTNVKCDELCILLDLANKLVWVHQKKKIWRKCSLLGNKLWLEQLAQLVLVMWLLNYILKNYILLDYNITPVIWSFQTIWSQIKFELVCIQFIVCPVFKEKLILKIEVRNKYKSKKIRWSQGLYFFFFVFPLLKYLWLLCAGSPQWYISRKEISPVIFHRITGFVVLEQISFYCWKASFQHMSKQSALV